MSIILKSAKVINTESKYHGTKQDILISKGKIVKIAKSIPSNGYREINIKGLHVSKGWLDSSVCLGEPGYEERETIINGGNVAGKSGFTDIVLNSNTKPVIDSQADISFIKSKSAQIITNIHPIGAFSLSSKSKELAEIKDMKDSGAVGFYDYKKPIINPNLLKTALLYSQTFDALIMSFAQENSISNNGVINEGLISTSYGIKGIPTLSEEIQINRDLKILEYTGGKLHIPTISCKSSVDLIRQAKNKGLNISCSVAIHNLIFNDEKLKDFDTRYKVLPPLRTELDRKALVKGVEDGTIDLVTSDHSPIDVDHKKMDIDNAQYGTIGLESFFGALLTLFNLDKTIDIITSGKSIFNIQDYTIEEESVANLSLFKVDKEYTFSKSDILSKSKNSAFLGMKMKGRALGVVIKEKHLINE
ncbi:MAG: dihydroorotase [Cryomorphaceae bacterium]|nr:MAG: dihydroorotase [Cryomorphaceae bacterium]|tara:strand:- start:3269 stop:4522 length:1254 start_codon:yes stop_codon:yes gene_type:complete